MRGHRRRIWSIGGVLVCLAVLSALMTQAVLGAVRPAASLELLATNNASGPVVEKNISLELAGEAAATAMQLCTSQGHRVTVAVVDRAGLVKVILRGDGAGPHTLDSARLKAYTSASFRRSTGDLEATIQANPASTLRDIPNALFLRGGLPITVGTDVIGGIGVGGAPGGQLDEACAQAGINKIKDRLT